MAAAPIPPIIYGTAWKGTETAHWVENALVRGFRGVDTAAQPKHYHEPGVGEGLKRALATGLARDEVYLQTKFTPLSGQDPRRVPYDADASLTRQVKQSFASSLANLGVERLDALVLHAPFRARSDTLEAWAAMEALVHHGGVARLGISNCYDLALLEWLHGQARVKPAIVQNRFYKDSGYDVAIRAFCRAHGITYQSFWTLTANPGLLASATLVEIARRHKRTPAQILFRWLNHDGVVPLTGTRSITHMVQDLALFEFALDTDERAEIESLLQ
jgi:diketogulonate reductase-like aldo/keto reductase